ncbi:MAG TPA: glycerol-3-phosphate acyltransferase [Bacteroidota bacterium]
MIPYVFSILGGYLVGSIPTGYLLVRLRYRVDLRSSGSGNVGALNVRVVSGSKSLGITVGILDGLKGLAVVLASWAISDPFWVSGAALLAAVIGHNYPVWLKFKGGRGLATACGGLFAIGIGYTIVWCTLWSVLKWQRQSILRSNVIATAVTPAVLFLLPAQSLSALMLIPASAAEFRILSMCLSVLLLVSHIDVFKEAQQEVGS